MSNYRLQPVMGIHSATTGALVGFLGADGREYMLPVSAAFAATAAVDGAPVGATTPSSGSFTTLRSTTLQSALTDGSGTPGNVTQNVEHGRAAFAAAASTVVVTNSQVAANSTVLVSLGGSDATLTSVRVTPAAGSFTVTGNAAATGTTPFDYIVIQN